ncbi:MAG: hypothetical protein RR640_01545, partial [Oscillospiraceae bacterium]
MSTEKILKGMLIVNGFLKGEKYSLVEEYLIKEAALQNIELFVQTNTNLLLNIRNNNFSQLKTKLKDNNFIIFWDKDIFLAKSLEQLGFKVFNNSFSIENCDDKRRTHFILAKNKINSPQSIFAPFTFENIGYNSNEYLKYIEKDLKYPIIIKEAFGSFGIIKKIGAKPFIFQKNINSLTTVEKLNNINNHKNAKLLVDKAGDVSFDVRICVVGERVVASMIRYSLNKDFRANLTNGGKMIINDATIRGIQGALATYTGELYVYDGHYSTQWNDTTSYYALYIAGEAGNSKGYIYGGHYSSPQYAAYIGNDGDGGIYADANVIIYNGEFVGKKGSVSFDKLTAKDPQIKGGHYFTSMSEDGPFITDTSINSYLDSDYQLTDDGVVKKINPDSLTLDKTT